MSYVAEVDAGFTRYWLETLNALCASFDARMVASPQNARAIRMAAQAAIARHWTHAAPDPTWPADRQARFAAWLEARAQAATEAAETIR